MKYEIGEILTPETAKEHVGEMVLVWCKCDPMVRKLVAVGSGLFWATNENSSTPGSGMMATAWDHAALPANPKPNLWVGDPVMVCGIMGIFQSYWSFNGVRTFGLGLSPSCIWRLPTRAELKAAGYPEEQIAHLMARWQSVDEPPKKPTCTKCGGTGFIKYYHDAGDHFSACPAPDSGWRERPCDCKE